MAAIRTLLLQEEKAVDEDKVRDWLDNLLWRVREGEEGAEDAGAEDAGAEEGEGEGDEGSRSMEIYRMKGVLRTRGGRRVVVQAVQELYDLVDVGKWEGQGGSSRVVVIGRRLEEEALRGGLAACAGG